MLVDAHTHGSSQYSHVRLLSLEEVRGELAPAPHLSVGLHPWDLAKTTPQDRQHIQRWARHPAVVALGETGLDRARRIDWELQLQSLRWHWDLCEERGLPLVLHCVRSSSDLLQLLKRRRPRTAWLWHDFSGPIEVIKSVEKLHPEMYFSCGPRGMARSDFSTLWNALPAERKLLETDDSGADLLALYQEVQPPEDLIERNFKRLFRLTGQVP